MSHLYRLRKNEETARAGIQWNTLEDQQLLKEIEEKLSYETISIKHQRTLKSIQYRAIILGMKNYRDTSLEELASKINLDTQIIKDYILHKEEKQILQEEMLKDRGISLKDLYNVMVDIRSLLQGIATSKGL